MENKSRSKFRSADAGRRTIFAVSIRNLREKCRTLIGQLHGVTPGFAVVQVGNREDSNVYIRHKMKAAEEIGIRGRLVRLEPSTSETQVKRFLTYILHLSSRFS